MSSKPNRTLQVTCPHCGGILTVDAETGDVLHSKQAVKRELNSFEDALAQEKERQSRTDDLFAQAIQVEKRRKELLEKKFQEAQTRTDDDGLPPPKPFDFD